MKKSLLLLIIIFLAACKSDRKTTQASFTTVEADTLFTDSISIRAIAIDSNRVWYAGSRGKYGYVPLGKGKSFNGVVAQDSVLPGFRAIAQTAEFIYILNVGTPAQLYKISKDGKQNKMVYTETGEKVFYDAIQFYNDNEGIAMGDPTDGCLSVIVTRDGGESWSKLPCDALPATEDGEAAFAASNTNIVVKGDKTWIVSGGKKSRVFYSGDRGRSWEAFDTPVIQGTESQGIYSVDFYNEKIGFAVGGDYTKPEMNDANKIRTTNGGTKWITLADKEEFGYASCVQFVPDGEGYELVTIGPSGLFYSFDMGKTWKKIYDCTTLHTLKFADSKTIIAAGEGKIVRLRLK